MKTYTDHDGKSWHINDRYEFERSMFADLVAALEIARAYQARCERLERDCEHLDATVAEAARHVQRLTNQLRNAEAACIDAGTWCDGPGDLVAAIGRLGAK